MVSLIDTEFMDGLRLIVNPSNAGSRQAVVVAQVFRR